MISESAQSPAVNSPVLLQNWETVTFLHWRYPGSVIQPFLPKGLTVDVFDNSAWVGLIPFEVKCLRSNYMPPLPWVSQFPETNVRTYVRGPNGERATWFFTLEADRLVAVLGARSLYGLPYHWSQMRLNRSGDAVEYSGSRSFTSTPVGYRVTIRAGKRVQPDELEQFLTARYRLYTTFAGNLIHTDVEHESWPLRKAEVVDMRENLLQSSGLIAPSTLPLVHFSDGVRTRIGAPGWRN